MNTSIQHVKEVNPCLYQEEKEFIWVLQDEFLTTVFRGFDHIRRTTKAYSSHNGKKMMNLARKMAKDYSTDVIVNFDATISD